MKGQYVKKAAFCIGLSCCFNTLFACKVIGKVIASSGDATASGRSLARGADICEGDQIKTAVNSKVSYKLQDGSFFVLSQKSAMQVKKFTYNADGKNNEFQAKLVSGKIKTRTGEIGREAKHSDLAEEAGIPKSQQVKPSYYKLEAGVATVGVRGTAFAAALTTPSEHLGIETIFENHHGETSHQEPELNLAVFSGIVDVVVQDFDSGQLEDYSYGYGSESVYGHVGADEASNSFVNQTGISPDRMDYLDGELNLMSTLLGLTPEQIASGKGEAMLKKLRQEGLISDKDSKELQVELEDIEHELEQISVSDSHFNENLAEREVGGGTVVQMQMMTMSESLARKAPNIENDTLDNAGDDAGDGGDDAGDGGDDAGDGGDVTAE